LNFVGVCLFLSCVLFCEKRLKLRSERTSQSFTSRSEGANMLYLLECAYNQNADIET